MLKPLALAIGLRYTRAKKRNHFISFISLTSMLGIAIGVMVLIVVLSVMNGFDYEIHHRFFSMAPEVTISRYDGKINSWQKVQKAVKDYPGVTGVAPYVGGQGLLTYRDQIVPVVVTGILPDEEEKLLPLKDKVVEGSLNRLDRFGIVLGRTLANKLGTVVGDKVTLMIPKATVTLAGMVPRFKRFTVVGIFSAGSGFNFDSQLSFINLHNAQKLFQLGESVSGLRVKINDVYAAPNIAEGLHLKLKGRFYVGDWTQQYGAFFKAVKMEKTMMFLILLLIIAVAAFNLVSSLVMVVNDKRAEIAILRTIGASPTMILQVFIVQGTFVGLIGIALGLSMGLLIAYNATEIVDWLQTFLGTHVLSANVYFVDYLPSKVQWADVLKVCLMALTMSFMATLYPALKASKTQPAEALRYE